MTFATDTLRALVEAHGLSPVGFERIATGKFNERFTCGSWLGEGSVELKAWLSGVRNAEGGVLDGLFDLGGV